MKQWKRVSSALLAVILLAVMVLVNPNVTKASSRLETMTAFDLTNDIKIGWNLGNSLESTNITWISNPSVSQYETAWGNPVTTKAMIDEIKKAGFNTVRIPVTWDTKVGSAPNYTINADWMNRVQEVVNYAIDNGMYVILNSHHDTNWIIPKTSNQSTVTAKLSSIWKQIATRFQNYDEHLIFETLNEPRVIGDSTEWTGGTSEYRSVINAYNLAAVNAIRSTGGNNLYRFILIPTHGDSTATAAMNDLVIPNNDKRCIVTLHMYSPYSFAMDKNGTSTWGSDYDKSSLDSELDAIYNKFISKGIAVILGEFGSINKNNESSRVAHAAYYVKAAKIRQIPVIWWDNNSFAAGTGETFGLFNRNSLSWQFPTILSALMNAAATSTATPTPTPTTAPTATPTTAPTTAPTATPTMKPTTTPTVAPTTAPTNGSFALKSTLNSWGTGYTMNIDITNTSNSTVNGWTLTLNKADFTITNIWNAEMTVSGDSIIIKPLSWNSTLNPGSMASFGFQGNGTPVTNFNYTIK